MYGQNGFPFGNRVSPDGERGVHFLLLLHYPAILVSGVESLVLSPGTTILGC